MKKVFFSFLVALNLVTFANYPLTAFSQWNKVPLALTGQELTCIGASNNGAVFLGTSKKLFRSKDQTRTWQSVFTLIDDKRAVNDIFFDIDGTVYICTEQGIFASDDNGEHWQSLFLNCDLEDKNVMGITIDHENNYVYVLKKDQLYKARIGEELWEKVEAPSLIFSNSKAVSDDQDLEEHTFTDISMDKKGNLYLASTQGVIISKDHGLNWTYLADKGSYCRRVKQCEISHRNDSIYLATDKGVFKYEANIDKWETAVKGLSFVDVKDVFIADGQIYIVAGNDIYLNYSAFSEMPANRGFTISMDTFKTDQEPTIQETQEMAVKYAEVHPDKIKKWRKNAQLKALVPRVTMGIDMGASDTYEIYTSSSNSYWVNGPRDETHGWDVTFVWDLGDFLYSEAQTSIDNRSKLMVQLRTDLLSDLTRIYFERKRLQQELVNIPIDQEQVYREKELRIQELTAYLDAYTGSWFSEQLQISKG